MEPNIHSTGRRPELEPLVAAVEELDAQDTDRLTDLALSEQVVELRLLLDRLEGRWLQRLAALDARRAAGADQDQVAVSTASWLHGRLRLSAGAASRCVRTARALFRGPLAETARALTDGELSAAHASVVAAGTQDLPDHVAMEAEPVLVEAARRLDPSRLRRLVGHLRLVVDPDGAGAVAERRHARRGVWLAPTWEGMVAINGVLEPEAGHTVLSALEPLARPARADDTRSGGQRTADALTELARRALEGGRLPQTAGVRPQLTVVVDLDSLLGRPGSLGGEAGWAGPLEPETCRRLACDGSVTRVLVSRHPANDPHPALRDPGSDPHAAVRDPGSDSHPAVRDPGSDPQAGHRPGNEEPGSTRDPCDEATRSGGLQEEAAATRDRRGEAGLAARLRAAAVRLPPVLGGAAAQPLEVGRATRVVQPAQRTALAVRDGGCVFPGCDRPLAWCEAHHLVHWLHGGPTDLDNLALLCRAHHQAVHEGGWRLRRGPDGRLTASPPHRRHRAA